MRRTAFWTATLLVLGLTGRMTSQDAAQAPTFRAASTLVVVDMVAVGRDGSPVLDLQPGEIEVKENGRRQEVQLLRLVGAERTSADTNPATTAGTAPVALSSVPDVKRRLVVVIDRSSLAVDAVARVQEAVAPVLGSLPAGTPMALVTLEPDAVIRQDFTTDAERIRAAVADLTAQLDIAPGLSSIFDAVDRVCAATREELRVVAVAVEAGERVLQDHALRSRAAVDGLAAVAARLATVEGRKQVVLYSAGHAIDSLTPVVDAVTAAAAACTRLDVMELRPQVTAALSRYAAADSGPRFASLLAALNRAQASFYVQSPNGIAPVGVAPSERGGARSGGSGPMPTFAGILAPPGRDFLEGLAYGTGGLLVRSNGLADVLTRAVDDARSYYLVGYQPTVPAGGDRGMRRIDVRVKRRGVTVRHRQGYLAAPSATDAPVSTASAVVPPTPEVPAPAVPVVPVGRATGPRETKAPMPPETREVLERASAYVDRFVARVANAVLEERMQQSLITASPAGLRLRGAPPGTTTRRRLVADLVLLRPRGSMFWLLLRDVLEVDGRPVADGRERVQQVLTAAGASSLAQAQQIAAIGSAHLLGRRTRTTTSPVFALAFLQAHHQSRFSYRLERDGNQEGRPVVLRLDETQRPTLLRTESGGDLPLHARFEIDAGAGAVVASEITLGTLAERLVLKTRFAFDERLQGFVPSELLETHHLQDGSTLTTSARYGRIRLFDVQTGEDVKRE